MPKSYVAIVMVAVTLAHLTATRGAHARIVVESLALPEPTHGLVVRREFTSPFCNETAAPKEVVYDDHACYPGADNKTSARYKCVEPRPGLCAFYRHFVDPNCAIPATNHSLLCDTCYSESTSDFTMLQCNVTGKKTVWHGSCQPGCDLATCKYTGVDPVGQCLLTAPNSPWPAVMLVGFDRCQRFVQVTQYDSGSECDERSGNKTVMMLPTDICDSSTEWLCRTPQ
jgi:hypothetical protein